MTHKRKAQDGSESAIIEDYMVAENVFRMGCSRLMAVNDLGFIKPLKKYVDIVGMTAEQAFQDVILPAEAARRQLEIPDRVWKYLFENQPYKTLINMLLSAQEDGPQTVEEQVATLTSKSRKEWFERSASSSPGPIQTIKLIKAMRGER